jgi:hypothetical protein
MPSSKVSQPPFYMQVLFFLELLYFYCSTDSEKIKKRTTMTEGIVVRSVVG